MSKIRANAFLFFPLFMQHIYKNLRTNVTVTPFVYDRQHDFGICLEFEVRVTKIGALKTPATRRPSAKKQFTDRLVRLNARRYATTKGKQR